MNKANLVLLIFSIFLLFNCKKAKDDPLISLRSRDHRLVGTRKWVKANVTYVKYLSKQINTYTETELKVSGVTIYNTNMIVPCAFSIRINKNGTTEYDYLNSNTKDTWH